MYDIFFVGKKNKQYNKLKNNFLTARQVDTVFEAQSRCLTEFYWIVWNDIELDKTFDFSFVVDEWSKDYVHQFKNAEHYDGICLIPKKYKLSNEEIELRIFKEKKYINVNASTPKNYERFTIETYDDYLDALKNSNTELFWAASNNVNISNFNFDIYFTHDNEYDRKQNHAFIHRVDNKDFYNGVFLLTKSKILSRKEIEHRFLVERKEWPVVASGPVEYDRFTIETYDDYLAALKTSKTEMFWALSNNIKIDDDFDFDIYFTHDNEYDRKQNHAFIHQVNGETFYNGLFLFSKHKLVTRKEIEHRHIVDRKEWPVVASGPVQYDRFTIETYDDYLAAMKDSKTEMFWALSNNIKIDDDFDLKLYLSHDEYDRKQNHAFIHRVDNKDYYNGVFLFSKHKLVSEKEIAYRHLVERKEWNNVASGPVEYDRFTVETYDDYLYASENSKTEMFWATSSNVDTSGFNFDIYFTHDNEYDRKQNHAFIHRVDDEDFYNGIFLFSKHKLVTRKEIEHRHVVDRKEWPVVASGPVQYDRFTVETYDDYLYALENSNTEMFWALSNNIKIDDDFDFNIYFTHDNEYDRAQNHAFIHRVDNEDFYNGIFLFSKHTPISEKEITYRHLVDRKEWPVVASGPIIYDRFTIETYDDYLAAMKDSKTEMFWAISNNIKIDDDFDFDIYFTHDNEYDRKQNHVFVHQVNGETFYNGVFLLSKYKPISEREVEYRHLVERKEWTVVASGPVQYDRFIVETYDDYLYALENSNTEMFWATSNNIKIDDDFDFGIYFSHNNEHDRTQNHVFIHRVNDEDFYNGVFLLSKHKRITQHEVEYRHLVERKEWPVVASGPVQYDRFTVETYDGYLAALKDSKTEMFWMIPTHVYVDPDFNFSTYFTHDNGYDRSINHSFLNGKYHDGIYLCTKQTTITQREFNYSFISNKKEINVIASTPKPYDIAFISYQEPNCDENYAKLLEQYPNAKRVHGVKGIHQAHIEAAKLCKTDMFWIIDGDAELVNTFDLDYQVARWDIDTVHVWRSKNPINNLVYGYGGIKLFPRLLTINMDITKPDMTTSISRKFKAVHEISNITAFNTDPFNTWKSAFRECTKLASKIIDRQKDDETLERLEVWKTIGNDALYGSYAIAGAVAGAEYGEKNKNNIESLKKINDFDWLKEQFDATQK